MFTIRFLKQAMTQQPYLKIKAKNQNFPHMLFRWFRTFSMFEYSFSVTSAKLIFFAPTSIKQRELSLTPNITVLCSGFSSAELTSVDYSIRELKKW